VHLVNVDTRRVSESGIGLSHLASPNADSCGLVLLGGCLYSDHPLLLELLVHRPNRRVLLRLRDDHHLDHRLDHRLAVRFVH
jgi:hypothetical protein